jgi:SNF2 family DNA or RNA helicase
MTTLPHAAHLASVRSEVRLRPVSEIAQGQLADLTLYQLKLMAYHLRLVAGFDELLALEAIAFQPFDYQIRAARTALRRLRGRALLADEVGLGKTIEAGLVLKEYVLRQMAARILILTPPGLVEQWQEELAVKFNLTDFVTSNAPDFRSLGPAAWERFPQVIASLATARRVEHAKIITALEYDLVIVDEAHHLKNRTSASWQLVNALQKKYILLLTATPVQNRLSELHNLITVLKPGQLKSPKEFSQQFVVRGDPRLPKNRALLRDLLGDVMVRHSRSQISLKLPPRRAHTIRLQLHPDEQALYDGINVLARRMLADESRIHRFGVLTLLREAGSSAAATVSTLHTLAESKALTPHRPELLRLAGQAAAIQASAKADALAKLLAAQLAGGQGDKVLVFTQFRATQEMLAGRLRQAGIGPVLYHGSLSTAQKDAAIRQFQANQPVLLSTEAAGEGRNLQFCRAMVNFDLPWNPMRIEQRVGRIHRIGQDRPVDIFNLAADGTIEDFVLDILDRKLNMFELVIGEVDMILGQMGDERDFEEIVLEIWAQAQSPEELRHGMAGLGEELAKAQTAYQHTLAYDEALFGEDFSAE